MFDSVAPGNYEVIASAMADFFKDTLAAEVISGRTTLTDFLPSFDTARVPVVTEFLPVTTDSLPFNQVFTLKFNIPMNRSAVESALLFEPAANVTYEWDVKSKLLTVRPVTGFVLKDTVPDQAHHICGVPLGCSHRGGVPGLFRDKGTSRSCY
jgi:hypothetical protein